MTFRQAFVDGSRRLAQAAGATESPDLDARVLLAHAAGLSTASLLAHWPDPVPTEAASRFEASLTRRSAGEPVAWITGFKEFLGMEFAVEPGLLVPRADTETLVQAAFEACGGRNGLRVADVCTGTGCVAVGFAALGPLASEVWAGDLSPLAVKVARRNADTLLPPDRRVKVVESNLLAGFEGTWDLVLSNPPYLTRTETRDRVAAGWREPALALDGGEDGLDLIRALVGQAAAALNPGGWLLLEAADAQMDAIGALLGSAGLSNAREWTDLAGQRRVAGARRPASA
jgi:release factor glutamine methyltransferase